MELELTILKGTKDNFNPTHWGVQYFIFREDKLNLAKVAEHFAGVSEASLLRLMAVHRDLEDGTFIEVNSYLADGE